MPRTTLNLDAAVLRALRRRQQASGRSLGQLASELLAKALREPSGERRTVQWRSGRMGARVDLEDKEAVRRGITVRDPFAT